MKFADTQDEQDQGPDTCKHPHKGDPPQQEGWSIPEGKCLKGLPVPLLPPNRYTQRCSQAAPINRKRRAPVIIMTATITIPKPASVPKPRRPAIPPKKGPIDERARSIRGIERTVLMSTRARKYARVSP